MCLATVAKVLEVNREKGTAWVDFGGVRREARIDLMPDVKPGEYVLIHTGFIIEKVDEQTAREILSAWEEVFKAEENALGGYYYPGD
ncbi:MAG: HypC/HybG/HupF family hydrogenase formation chaperone [Thermococcus sp.]|uniref:Hydrogenase n=1 Tax=Thermococcus guaymasensis DSM 11113 TaxID=1432656 RepID=A0A0X1KJD2_9EURY|nr:HypC/HybG/HupF family hydrogenase formation chaperone [Thermococcus guaymasensis]AJC71366.1 hydrogenase [Thermococcus guaymasensis DSM 11113]MCD6523895.1 HypC/HybG/HupF family hydrogenase formation chaperone [Thermococcus sp.]